jgi:2'-5' RNA ligase
MKYIIALLALNPNAYVDQAQTLFSNVHHKYLLGPDSRPHCTLVQFYATEEQFNAIARDLKASALQPIEPIFEGFYVNKDEIEPDTWWTGYSIARTENLIRLHAAIVSILKKQTITPTNRENNTYRPHLTLARIKTREVLLPLHTMATPPGFALALGAVDEYGQFIKLIAVLDTQKPLPTKPRINNHYDAA